MVVVFWSVELLVLVDEGVHFCADAEGVEVGDIEDVQFFHNWFGVAAWWFVSDYSYYFLLYSDEGLKVGFVGVV